MAGGQRLGDPNSVLPINGSNPSLPANRLQQRRMTERTRRIERLREVDDWFAQRGFGLIFTEEDGEFWSHLFPKQSLQVTVPRNGRGDTPDDAAESARKRFRTQHE